MNKLFIFVLLTTFYIPSFSVETAKKIKIVKTNNGYEFLNKTLISVYSEDLSKLKKLRKYVEKKGFPKRKVQQTDLEFIVQSMGWVTSQWKHNGWNKAPSKFRAIDILNKVHNNGEKYRCVEYGLVLTEILQAYGFLSRSVGLNSLDVDYGGFGRGHVASEIWSDELTKWIFFDPQFGVYVTNNKGVPLSYYEIYKEFKVKKWKGLKAISLLGVEAGSSPDNYEKFISQYFGYLNVDLGKDKYALGLDATKPVLTFQGMQRAFSIFTKNHRHLYPKLNKVTLFLKYDYDEPTFENLFKGLENLSEKQLQSEFDKRLPKFAAKPIFKVTMKNNMPNFSYYEYRIGENTAWKKLKNKHIKWEATSPKNHIYVRAVNKLNKPGPTTFMELHYN